MNSWQILRQLQFLGQQLTWTGGAKVFGGVVISATPKQAFTRLTLPALVIEPVVSESYGEHTCQRRLRTKLHVFVENLNDPLGQAAMLDGAATADTSRGVGLARLTTRLRDALNNVSDSDGIEGLAWMSDAPKFESPPNADTTLLRAVFEVQVYHDDTPTFPGPTSLSATAGVAAVNLSWTLPATRFDRVGVLLRRKTGGYPTTVTDGTQIVLGDSTSIADTGLMPGVPVYYKLWGAYDADFQGGTLLADTFSPTVKTATATPS